jgi:hypothetical protein
LLVVPAVAATPACAQEEAPKRGVVSFGLQTVRTDSAFSESGGLVLPSSSSEAWVSILEFEYALSEQWSLYLGVPYIRKKFTGFPPHNPALLDPPQPDAEFIDDGDTHGGLQDWRAAITYRKSGRNWQLAPFVRLEVPSRDYPHFGSAAIGQNLVRGEIGVDFSQQVAFTNFYYGAGYSYTIVEETLGVNVNYNRVPLRAGYFFNPRWSAELFAEGKLGKGRDAADYGCGAYRPDGSCIHPVFDENWYQHDRQLRHDYVTMGVGSTYWFNDATAISLSTWKMVWGRTINRLDLAADLTISRRF